LELSDIRGLLPLMRMNGLVPPDLGPVQEVSLEHDVKFDGASVVYLIGQAFLQHVPDPVRVFLGFRFRQCLINFPYDTDSVAISLIDDRDPDQRALAGFSINVSNTNIAKGDLWAGWMFDAAGTCVLCFSPSDPIGVSGGSVSVPFGWTGDPGHLAFIVAPSVYRQEYSLLASEVTAMIIR
jgi:hypothetical protein